MKIYINFFKFLFILFLSSFIFFTACDLLSTYSEDEYLALGKKDKDDKSSSIQVILEGYNYTINSGGFFNFDNIPVDERPSEIVFRIYNNGSASLTLSGDPKIVIDSTDFTVNQDSISSTISPDDWTTFSVTFTSSSVNGDIRLASIYIPNNSNNNQFVFTIGCTAKASDIKEFFYIGGITENWSCSAYNASLDITLVGGGGGGGGGGDHWSELGGGGGGAGQLITFNIPQDENYQYSIYIGARGSRGWDENSGSNGQSSYINYNGIQVIANYGSGGITSSNGGHGGAGYPNGQSSFNLHDEGNGAPGGNNGRGYGEQADEGDDGNDAPANSGGGGSGGGAGQNRGGHGGTGYCRIEWVGFLIP